MWRGRQQRQRFWQGRRSIADKILIMGALIALMRTKDSRFRIGAYFLIIARELLMGGLRILSSSQGKISGAEPWGNGRWARKAWRYF